MGFKSLKEIDPMATKPKPPKAPLAGPQGFDAKAAFEQTIRDRTAASEGQFAQAASRDKQAGAIQGQIAPAMSDMDRKAAQGIASARSAFASGGGARYGAAAETARQTSLDKGLFGTEMITRASEATNEAADLRAAALQARAENENPTQFSAANLGAAQDKIRIITAGPGNEYGKAQNILAVLMENRGLLNEADYNFLASLVNQQVGRADQRAQ